MGILKEIKQNNRKRIWKTLIILILIISGGFGYYYFKIKKNTTQIFKIYTVEKRDIESTISADGKVEYKEQYDLNFPTSGTLSKVYKKEGEVIKKGELIASLDDSYLKINLDKAIINLDTAKANLDAKLATRGLLEDVNVSQKQLDSSKTSLDTNIRQSGNEIKIAEENLISSQTEYANAVNSLDIISNQENLNIKNAIEKTDLEIDNAIPFLEQYLRDIDNFLGISDTTKNLNDPYELYIGAKNTPSLYNANNSYLKGNSILNDFKVKLAEYNNSGKSDEIKLLSNELIEIETNIGKALGDVIITLNNTVSSQYLLQSVIDSKIQNYQNQKNNIETLKQRLSASTQSITNAEISLETKIKNQKNLIISAKSKIDIAQTNLNSANSKLDNVKKTSDSQVQISEANLTLKKSGPDKRELEPYYAAITSANKGIEEAKKRLDDSKIISPIEGKIGKMSITKVGTIISQNPINPFLTIINKDSLFITAKIEEGDISRIKLGQNVHLTFNSLDSVKLDGNVSYISDKAEIDGNGIVSYKIEVSFKPLESGVKEGFTTQIFFIEKNLKDVASLPFEAVTQEGDKYFVTTLGGVKTEIKVGINDGDYYEILDGVKIGDKLKK